jgi:hypothetical protein
MSCLDAHNLERRIEREVPSRLCAPRQETSRSMRRCIAVLTETHAEETSA